ncbi:hypothetical protein JL2886_03162 [Phaeobacter gallaeciensis]|uniref:Uncharacterized protein n=1 Tax=Phaeobacter gallaeciensis TaxID=60890 RepID=A0A1B0ZVC2_9RHOB|nr:hypothetical protein JL2886_03162 [Phaeobacter gallaeciensis]
MLVGTCYAVFGIEIGLFGGGQGTRSARSRDRVALRWGQRVNFLWAPAKTPIRKEGGAMGAETGQNPFHVRWGTATGDHS